MAATLTRSERHAKPGTARRVGLLVAHPFNQRRIANATAAGSLLVLDSAYPQWTISSLKAAHVVAVSRYLAPDKNGQRNPKCIGPSELKLYVSNGIAVCFNWESTGKTWRGGHAAGVSEGKQARAQMRRLGVPDATVVTHSIDEAVAYSQVPTAVEWMAGVNDGHNVGRKQGCYATYPVLDALHKAGHVFLWQTNARAWTGNRPDYPHATMYQHGQSGVAGIPVGSYDWNTIPAGVVDFGQYPAPVKPPPPPPDNPPVVVPVEEDEMALVQGDAEHGRGQQGFPFAGNGDAVWQLVYIVGRGGVAAYLGGENRAWIQAVGPRRIPQAQVDALVKITEEQFASYAKAGQVT